MPRQSLSSPWFALGFGLRVLCRLEQGRRPRWTVAAEIPELDLGGQSLGFLADRVDGVGTCP